ncbi:hypothetical protein GCM10020331_033780 [Ectobacillus funiculus]
MRIRQTIQRQKKIYETVREEIDMHMGPGPSKAIMQNFEKAKKR